MSKPTAVSATIACIAYLIVVLVLIWVFHFSFDSARNDVVAAIALYLLACNLAEGD